jgi:DNA (cytosine-5)-methyltransferase 1
MGFDANWGVLGAADVGAKHKRDRIWIVGYTNDSKRRRELRGFWGLQECIEEWDAHSTFNQPEPVRMVDGIPNRVDRLKLLGNAQVPLCAATAWRVLTKQI